MLLLQNARLGEQAPQPRLRLGRAIQGGQKAFHWSAFNEKRRWLASVSS